MLLKEDTKAVQQQLAGYCRDGILVEIPGARSERLPHYRRLVFNVMYGILEKAFPVANSLLETAEFKAMVSDFLERHSSLEPQVWMLPGEFYNYFENTDSPLKSKYPFLSDLLQMEWKEILVFNRENRAIPNYQPVQTIDNQVLILNPDFEILSLIYPVFRGNFEEIGNKLGDYRLLIFRNTETNKVHFIEISPVHQLLIDGLSGGADFNAITSLVFEQLGIREIESPRKKLLDFCHRLMAEGFILGAASQ